MKRVLLLPFHLLLIAFPAFSQDKTSTIHSPSEILQIMSDSKMNYEITLLENPVLPENHSDNLNYPTVYRRKDGNGLQAIEYEPNAESEKAYKKAEEAFSARDYEKAGDFYQEALDKDSSYYIALTYRGQMYGIQRQWDKAIACYEKEIKQNYIDYIAHWFLADAYLNVGRKEEAKTQILIAHILNRNNPRLLDALHNIMRENKLVFDDHWQFTPQIELAKTGDKKFKVGYKGVWLGYAMAKALWKYEPGYKAKLGASDSSLFYLDAEKEAIIGLLVGADKEKKSKLSVDVKALQDALKNKMLDAFIYYEIMLPEYPYGAYQFPESLVNDIIEYLLSSRVTRLR